MPGPATPEPSLAMSPLPESVSESSMSENWEDLDDLGKPQGFDIPRALGLAFTLFGLKGTNCKELPSERDRNFRFTTKGDGNQRYVLKICNITESQSVVNLQVCAMDHLEFKRFPAPKVVRSIYGNEFEKTHDTKGRAVMVRCTTYIEGKLMSEVQQNQQFVRELGSFIGRMDSAMADFWHIAAHRYLVWDLAHGKDVVTKYQHFIKSPERAALIKRVLERYEEVGGQARMQRLRQATVHNDLNDNNIVVEQADATPPSPYSALLGITTEVSCTIAAAIDFGDMVFTPRVHNVAIALAYVMLGKDRPAEVAGAFLEAYVEQGCEDTLLTAEEVDVVLPLAALRSATSCTMAAHSSSKDPDNAYLCVTEEPAWDLLKRLDHFSVRDMASKMRAACNMPALPPAEQRQTWDPPQASAFAEPSSAAAALLATRKQLIGPNLSISYSSSAAGPIHMVSGRRAHMTDSEGAEYLDCVNNVSHVGHAHPRISAAALDQMRRLNTNTRYLSSGLNDYAEDLLATLPPSLDVLILVCTGSEANDLALRMARAYSDHAQDVVVMGTAYHGHTSALIELSPYKHEGKGGEGRPEHVHVVPAPDPMRGQHCDPAPGIDAALGAVEQRKRSKAKGAGRLAAFFCESIIGCAGQVVLPEGYLEHIYAKVRARGGVCVADEVQTGFGRVGTHFWAFETQGVCPDIVTMGKPMGNGYPIGAVATTRAIAERFNNGMEYFNTFGGSNVACAVGREVLAIIRDEGLMQNALDVGGLLLQGLEEIRAQFPCLGHVRGLGLFIGVDLVVPGEEGLPPAPALADWLVGRLRALGVLLSTDGPFHNVLKIKPPICFDRRDAARLLGSLARVLTEDLTPQHSAALRAADLEVHRQHLAAAQPAKGRAPEKAKSAGKAREARPSMFGSAMRSIYSPSKEESKEGAKDEAKGKEAESSSAKASPGGGGTAQAVLESVSSSEAAAPLAPASAKVGEESQCALRAVGGATAGPDPLHQRSIPLQIAGLAVAVAVGCAVGVNMQALKALSRR